MEKTRAFLQRVWKKLIIAGGMIALLFCSMFVVIPLLFPATPSTGDAASWTTLTVLNTDGSLRHNNATYATAWSATTALTNYTTSLYATIGQQFAASSYYISRGFLPFNLTGNVYATWNISSVLLSIAFYSTSAANNTLLLYLPEIGYATPNNPLGLTDYNQANYDSSMLLGSINCTTGAVAVNTYYNITLSMTNLQNIFNFTQNLCKLVLRTYNDVYQLAPTGATSNNTSVFYNENVTFAPKLYIQYSIDPMASGTSNQLRDPFQRKTFYTSVGQRSWVTFNNASGYPPTSASDAWFVLTSTIDNINFVDPIAIGNIGDGIGEGASLYYDSVNNYVHFAYKKVSTRDLAYRCGTPNGTDGSIVFTDETLIDDGNESFFFIMPSIVADSDGYAYVCAQIMGYVNHPAFLFKNAWNNGSWSTSWNYNFTQTASIGAGRGVPLRLLNGKVGVLHCKNGDYVYYSQWNSSSSTPEVKNETVSLDTCIHGDFLSGVTVLDNVHCSYLGAAAENILYRVRNSTSGTWGTETEIVSDAGTTSGAVMNWDKTDDSTRIFFSSKNNNHIYYKQCFHNGTITDATDFYTSTNQLTDNRTLHVSYEVGGYANITIAYQTGVGGTSSGAFHIYMLNIQINGTVLTAGWNEMSAVAQDVGHNLSELNSSLYINNINWTMLTVDYLNGTQWSMQYGTSYNANCTVTAGSELWIYCLDVTATWTHTYE